MNDLLTIATAFEDTVRVYAADTTRLVETARQIHDTWPTATAALGRTLTATLILGVMQDQTYRLTVRIAGNGPLGGILAVSNQRGNVKGYVNNPHVDPDLNSLGKLDVGRAVGSGQLVVTKDLGLKEPYQGVVPLTSGEIGEDFAHYFATSEQTPSAVALGVLVAPDGQVQQAGGLIIQMMPGVAEATVSLIEAKLKNIPPITAMLEMGLTPSELIGRALGAETDFKILETSAITYACDCSKERFYGPLLSLGASELDRLFETDGRIEVRCHFCNARYHYQRDSLVSGEEQHNA